MSVMESERDVRHRSYAKRRPRPCSASYIAVRAALYQLTRLNDFRLERIGGGFYADVFKVTHKTTGEVMVLKMNKNSKFSRQMLSEIQLMNRLSHPNILKFKGSCVHEGQLHALTEYINGGSLEDLLHNRSIHLSWSARVRIALDIAQGMAYLHSRGVFHRDLSSRNCLIQVMADGSMKGVVADFGLAAKIKQSRQRSHTEVVGSPYWMAPECLNGKEYCEQADVFSYGIVLAETMTRLPADPDFMPRTRIYGMDFEALHKMCLDCPQELWELMVHCCQIDPDERPVFEDAVKILEQVTVSEEGEGQGEGSRDEELRACFSEPLLRLQDSDDNLSFTSGQSSSHLPPINTADSLESFSANSLNSSLGRHHLESEDTTVPEDSKSDDVFEDVQDETEGKKLTGDSTHTHAHRILPVRTSFFLTESDDEGANKGDSGIDPGELFVAPVAGQCEPTVGNWESVSTNSESEKTPCKEHLEHLQQGILNSAYNGQPEGDITPPCLSPTLTPTIIPESLLSHTKSNTSRERAHPTTTNTAAPMFRSPSNDMVLPTTPCDRCYSPQAQGSVSDISLFIPNPSTPWAPPPSPLRSNSYRLSSSLPSSPAQTKRQFRFSMDVQDALFPPFDFGVFTLPSNFGIDSVNLRSTPKSSEVGGQASKCKRHSLRHSCGHNTPLPTFPEDSETEHGLYDTALWRKGNGSLRVNLDRERFSQHISPLRRTRSASNPTPASLPVQPAQYALTLARYSPSINPHSTNSASLFKYYTIKPCVNCRLSSSEPNLTTCFSAQLS